MVKVIKFYDGGVILVLGGSRMRSGGSINFGLFIVMFKIMQTNCVVPEKCAKNVGSGKKY